MSFDPFELARKVDIVDLITNKYGLEVTTSGRIHYASCPQGSDTDPSLAIFTKDNRFHCYHCGWHGTAIDFVIGMENTDAVGALKVLDRMYPDLGIINAEARSRSEHVGRYFAYTEKTTAEEHNRLMNNKRYLTWVKTKRGFSEAAIRKYRLGVRELNGIPRLAIPLTSTGGRVLQAVTRQMTPVDPMSRYFIRNVRLNPETGQIIKKDEEIPDNAIAVFTKGEYLYGLDDVTGDTICLVEGELDRIAAWEFGVDNVGAYGTLRISDQQAVDLGRFRSVTLIPDLGRALDVVIENVETIRATNPAMPINIVDLSPWKDAELEGDEDFELKDVNDMLRYLSANKDTKLFNMLVESAQPVEGWLYHRYVTPVADNSGRAYSELQRILSLSTAPVARVKLVTLASEGLGLPAQLLLSS